MSRRMFVLLMAIAIVAGCGSEQGFTGVQFVNHTDVEVDVVFRNTNGDEEILIRGLDPGSQWTVDAFTTDCSFLGTYIARDASARDVARFDGPICRPSKWIIERSPSPVPAQTG